VGTVDPYEEKQSFYFSGCWTGPNSAAASNKMPSNGVSAGTDKNISMENPKVGALQSQKN